MQKRLDRYEESLIKASIPTRWIGESKLEALRGHEWVDVSQVVSIQHWINS